MRGSSAGTAGVKSPARTWAAVIGVNGATGPPSARRQYGGWAMSYRWCESSVTVMPPMRGPAAAMKPARRSRSACAPGTGNAGRSGWPVAGSCAHQASGRSQKSFCASMISSSVRWAMAWGTGRVGGPL